MPSYNPTLEPTFAPTIDEDSSPYPGYEYFGQGQCRNAQGSSPAHDNIYGIHIDQCYQDALASNAEAFECNGGQPDDCWCQLFHTGSDISFLSPGDEGFACYKSTGETMSPTYNPTLDPVSTTTTPQSTALKFQDPV